MIPLVDLPLDAEKNRRRIVQSELICDAFPDVTAREATTARGSATSAESMGKRHETQINSAPGAAADHRRNPQSQNCAGTALTQPA
jgi:hypothetical protein